MLFRSDGMALAESPGLPQDGAAQAHHPAASVEPLAPLDLLAPHRLDPAHPFFSLQTPVVLDGHLYGLDNSGSAGPITNLVCIRLSDRKTVWQKPRFGKSNLILADGRLWITTMKGELVLVEASPDSFRELGRSVVLETTRQAPALSAGRLYVRDDQHVICLDVRADK